MKDSLEFEKDLAREEVCRLLSACYYEPTQDFLEEDIFGRLSRHLELISGDHDEAAKEMEKSFRGQGTEALLLDYSRLFLGPFDIPAKPYGSVYLEGEKVVMGDSTVAVKELYRRGGFDLAEEFREMPDHIAAELEFLYLLIFRENEARRSGVFDQLEKVAALKKEFLLQHLGRWIAPFAEAVRGGAEKPFYRHLADLTEAFVRQQLAAVEADRAA